MTRHRYGESLEVWADEHGEPMPEPKPYVINCPKHGDFTPRHVLSPDCPQCAADEADATAWAYLNRHRY